jgi:hypothetical protein
MDDNKSLPTLSIDPGVHSMAWAFFDNKVLNSCDLIRVRNLKDLIAHTLCLIDTIVDPDDPTRELGLVIEKPQAFRGSKEDHNDLISLGVSIGAIIGAISSSMDEDKLKVHIVLPREWKGQRPKGVDNVYTRRLLTEDEVEIIDDCNAPKSLMHNVIDAVGIGLWRLGRR